MKYYGSLLLLLLVFFAAAQENPWYDYQPIQSKGPVPKDFTDNLLAELKKSDAKAKGRDTRKERNRAEDFYLKSTYEIRNLLNSGRISYGDTVSLYCQSVLDKVLKDFPKLRKEIRLYVNKNPQHNAFTTDEGIIFVNTGLLAQLETEAQLAFVLAHEVVHYAENHVIDEYLEFERIKDEDDEYDNLSRDEKISSISRFSKDSELEADALGYKRYFKNSGYSNAAPNQLMDIMLYSYLPFNEIEVKPDYLNIASLKVPVNFYKEKVEDISAIEDYDDSESTHPNIKKRRSTMLQTTLGDVGGEDFLISKDAFMYCRKLCRFENTKVFVAQRDYEKAIYNSYLLLLEEPESKFLKKCIAKSLYAFSTYANENELEDIQTDFEDIEGESQRVYFMLSEMTNAQLNVTAMAWILALKNEYPEDVYLKKAYERCLDGLVYENDFVYEDFSFESFEAVKARVEAQMAADTLKTQTSNSKVANIKKKKREVEGAIGQDFTKYALADFIGDSTLKADFERRDSNKEEQRDIFAFTNKTKKGDKSSIYDDNLALGIDKAVFVNPRYLSISDYYSSTELEREKTIANRNAYREKIRSLGEKVKLKTEFLEHEEIETGDAVEFNHHAAISAWLNERMSHTNTGVLVSETDYINDAKSYYNTNKIIFTGNYTVKETDLNVLGIYGTLFYSLFVYPAIPYLYSQMFTPDYYSFNFYYVFNLDNSDAILAENTYYQNPDSQDYLKSMLYNNLLQTKSKPTRN